MTALDRCLASNPDLAEKSYGDAMARSLQPSVSMSCAIKGLGARTKSFSKVLEANS
jgi:hypothetical protein